MTANEWTVGFCSLRKYTFTPPVLRSDSSEEESCTMQNAKIQIFKIANPH